MEPIKRMELREKLADLEHEQWMKWAGTIKKQEAISKERADRWLKLFVPYAELSEADKEHDRKWADKVLAIIEG